MLRELHDHLEPEERTDEDAPVRAAHRYLKNRLEQLDYAGARAQGLPIGSGRIESEHKHILQQRFKLPGMAWLPDNLLDMARLRVLRANGQYEHIWNDLPSPHF